MQLAQGNNSAGNVRGRVCVVLSTGDAFGSGSVDVDIALAGSDKWATIGSFTADAAFVTEPLPADTQLRIVMPNESTSSFAEWRFGYVTA